MFFGRQAAHVERAGVFWFAGSGRRCLDFVRLRDRLGVWLRHSAVRLYARWRFNVHRWRGVRLRKVRPNRPFALNCIGCRVMSRKRESSGDPSPQVAPHNT